MTLAIRVLLVATISLPLWGCNGSMRPGFPAQSYDENKQIKDLAEVFEKPDMLKDYYDDTKTPSDQKQGQRDKIITGRLVLIDLHYYQFISQFSVQKQTLDATTEILELGVNLATTAVGAAGTKTIFGAISSGISGSKLAIDKNFFYEKTVPVLISQMNAQRKEALAPIIAGTSKSVGEYPLTQALSDLNNYYLAGTFVGALQSIQADAGVKERKAVKKLDALRAGTYGPDETSEQISAWLWPAGKAKPSNKANVAKLNAWINESPIDGLPIQKLLDNKKLRKYRQQVINELKILPIQPPN